MINNKQIQDVGKYAPRGNKNLQACSTCKLIMQEAQWRKMEEKCPNCTVRILPNSDFVGMISVMMPRESWVAKWNEIRTCMPGLYAINVPQNDEEDQDEGSEAGYLETKKRRKNAYTEKSDDSFIAQDDDEY